MADIITSLICGYHVERQKDLPALPSRSHPPWTLSTAAINTEAGKQIYIFQGPLHHLRFFVSQSILCSAVAENDNSPVLSDILPAAASPPRSFACGSKLSCLVPPSCSITETFEIIVPCRSCWSVQTGTERYSSRPFSLLLLAALCGSQRRTRAPARRTAEPEGGPA